MVNRFNVIVADPPWPMLDSLTMSNVKRGAASQYSVLLFEDIQKLKVSELAADDAVLALWVPSSLLQDGLDVMKIWGFRQTQTHIWVKIKNNPFQDFLKDLKHRRGGKTVISLSTSLLTFVDYMLKLLAFDLESFDFNQILAFGMGRLFRQTHEICLIGVRGKIYNGLANKSQRSVHFDVNRKHSAKPEILQDRLEMMYPQAVNGKMLELFARRQRKGWVCLGNDSPMTLDEDIRVSINKLLHNDIVSINDLISSLEKSQELFELWKSFKTENKLAA